MTTENSPISHFKCTYTFPLQSNWIESYRIESNRMEWKRNAPTWMNKWHKEWMNERGKKSAHIFNWLHTQQKSIESYFATTEKNVELDSSCLVMLHFHLKICLKITCFTDWSSFAIITYSLFIGALDVQWCPTIATWRDQGWLAVWLLLLLLLHSLQVMNGMAIFPIPKLFIICSLFLIWNRIKRRNTFILVFVSKVQYSQF